MFRLIVTIALITLSARVCAQDRVHADLPLFDGSKYQLWPRNFSDGDSFGCETIIRLGDWTFNEKEPATNEWMRIRNYGVFHCAVVESWASDREMLDKNGYKYSWFVSLGKARYQGKDVDLWTLQSGARPGSDYLLLRRSAKQKGITEFDVLPVDCAKRDLRKGEQVDVWLTSYCAINDVNEFVEFAREMAKKPEVGKLKWKAEAPAVDQGKP